MIIIGRNLFIASLISILCLGSTAIAGQAVDFPGHDQAPDPSGRYTVLYTKLPEGSEHNHEVGLKDLRTENTADLLKFDRGITVLWAPDGNALAMTDSYASDQSRTVIVYPDRPAEHLYLEKQTETFFEDVAKLTEPHHLYYTAIHWQDPRKLLFKVSGYGDEARFEKTFEYELGGKISLISNEVEKLEDDSE